MHLDAEDLILHPSFPVLHDFEGVAELEQPRTFSSSSVEETDELSSELG